MRKTIGLLLATAMLAAGTANAQPIKPGTPSILRWTLEQQTEWYPAIETVYRTATVKRSDHVRPLPKAERSLDGLTWSHADKSWTVDDYMKAYNVSGVMVVKDGKVMLERYGSAASPRTAGSPSRSPSRSRRLWSAPPSRTARSSRSTIR